MDKKYEEWIALNVNEQEAYGNCDLYSQRMKDVFPELNRVAGFYFCDRWGTRTHWWLVAPDGTVVDPTAAQFPSKGRGVYQELEEEDRPSGVCMDCGSYVYRGDTFCSLACEEATRRYLETGIL